MTEASIIVNDALELAGISSAMTPPHPDQQARAFRLLSGMIAKWINDDIDISISQPYEIGDDLGEEAHITQVITSLLARPVAASFQADLNQHAKTLIAQAEDDLQILYDDSDNNILPANLPIGAGNKNSIDRRPFYEGKQ